MGIKRDRNNRLINIMGVSVILFTIATKCLRNISALEEIAVFHNPFLEILHIMFFAFWFIGIRQRVIQRHIRVVLLSIAGSELFWMLIRTVKYEFLKSVTSRRYSWYLYYLPMLLIPALFMLLAVFMGKPESDKPKRFLYVFPLLSVLLFGLVITNDIHSLVFIIPPGMEGLETGNYRYGSGYFVVATYISLCILASYGILLAKCRVNNGKYRHFLPIIPLAAGTALCILYGLFGAVLFGFYHMDVSLILCLTATFTLEACMQCGLILTNNGYDGLFSISSIRALITDKDFSPVIASEKYIEIPAPEIKECTKEPVMLRGGFRLSSTRVKGGYVFWQDDVSELDKTLRELSEVNDYLAGKSEAIRQAYAYKKKQQQLLEKNRLYNTILAKTKPEIDLYADLIEQLSHETDVTRKKEIALKIAFVSTFIKRRDNLIFLSEEDKTIEPAELYYCIDESLSALRLSGAECFCSYELKEPLTFAKATRIYEMFYSMLLDVLDKLSSVCAYLIENGGEAVLILRACCGEDEREATLK